MNLGAVLAVQTFIIFFFFFSWVMGKLEPFVISAKEQQKIPLRTGCLSSDPLSEVQYQCFLSRTK